MSSTKKDIVDETFQTLAVTLQKPIKWVVYKLGKSKHVKAKVDQDKNIDGKYNTLRSWYDGDVRRRLTSGEL